MAGSSTCRMAAPTHSCTSRFRRSSSPGPRTTSWSNAGPDPGSEERDRRGRHLEAVPVEVVGAADARCEDGAGVPADRDARPRAEGRRARVLDRVARADVVARPVPRHLGAETPIDETG